MTDDDDLLGEALAGLTDVQLRKKLDTLKQLREKRKYNRLEWFEPYPKQEAHYALGRTKRERLLTAGNQQGKTECGAAEAAYHATGLYPQAWDGRRWDRPNRGWVCGRTGLTCRDILQKKLCGEPGVSEQFGSGMLPKHLIVDVSLARGITDLFDTIQVRHVAGGISVMKLKSYEMGREKFEGETLDWIWNDEEPPFDIYMEELARIGPLKGMITTTFTSMRGRTQVTDLFFPEGKELDPDRGVTQMGILDAPHMDFEAEKNKYPKNQQISRLYGGIMQGVGRVFDLDRDAITEPAISPVPAHWLKIWGVDFGIAHYFAAALLAIDPDSGCIHVIASIRMKDALPLQHAVPMKAIGADVPVAWPHDGGRRDPGSGEPLSKLYKAQGLRMLPSHATFPDGSVSTEAGYMEMNQAMQGGLFKVASQLGDWLDEFDGLHRDETLQIVKVRDDLLSATRTAVMAKRFAKMVMLGSKRPAPGQDANGGLAVGIEFDLS